MNNALLKKTPRSHSEQSEEALKQRAVLQFMKNLRIAVKRTSEGIFRELAAIISFRTATRLAKTSFKEVKGLALRIKKLYEAQSYEDLKELFLQIDHRQSAKAIGRNPDQNRFANYQFS